MFSGFSGQYYFVDPKDIFVILEKETEDTLACPPAIENGIPWGILKQPLGGSA